jgi:hypothetical protein
MSNSRTLASVHPVDAIEALYDPTAISVCSPQTDQVATPANDHDSTLRFVT